MKSDEKAKKLVEDLQVVLSQAQGAEKDACCEELSPQELRALCAVGREKCCVMSGIARAVRLSLSTVTGLIDRLVEKKLVRRDRSHEDRRVVEVQLTDEGRALHAAAMESQEVFARDLLSALSSEEQEALVSLFGKISGRIKKEKRAA
jgi:DNA-binding MarR family transcriptional regulator